MICSQHKISISSSNQVFASLKQNRNINSAIHKYKSLQIEQYQNNVMTLKFKNFLGNHNDNFFF